MTAHAHDLGTGDELTIRAAYLIGCEGGRSLVRRAIGAKLIGDEVIQRVQSSYIRARDLIDRVTNLTRG